MNKALKYGLIALAALAVLTALGAHIATRMVETRIVRLLGDQGSAESIHVGLSTIVLQNVRVGAPPEWPVKDTLRAARIELTPDWRALLSHRISIRRAVATDYYLSILREKGGRLRIVPTLHERAEARAQAGSRDKDAAGSPEAEKRKYETVVGMLILDGGKVDFFDSTVAAKPFRVPLENVHAEIGPLHAPATNDRTSIDGRGQVIGKNRRGATTMRGWIALKSKDTDVRNVLTGVDVAAVSPYLRGSGTSAALTGGSMDLNMHTRVKNRRLDANGRITLRDLDFGSSGNELLSLPRKAVLAALEDRNGAVTFDFTLQGDIQDPKFSLNDSLSMRLAGGFAQAIGVSVEGVAGGVGEAVKGLGGALNQLFGE